MSHKTQKKLRKIYRMLSVDAISEFREIYRHWPFIERIKVAWKILRRTF